MPLTRKERKDITTIIMLGAVWSVPRSQTEFARFQIRERGFSVASLEDLHYFCGLQELLHTAITGIYC